MVSSLGSLLKQHFSLGALLRVLFSSLLLCLLLSWFLPLSLLVSSPVQHAALVQVFCFGLKVYCCPVIAYQLMRCSQCRAVLLHGDRDSGAMALLILSIVVFPGNCQVSGQRAEDSAEVIDSHVLGRSVSQDGNHLLLTRMPLTSQKKT